MKLKLAITITRCITRRSTKHAGRPADSCQKNTDSSQISQISELIVEMPHRSGACRRLSRCFFMYACEDLTKTDQNPPKQGSVKIA